MNLHKGGWAPLGALLMAVAGLAHADTLIGVLPTTPGGTDYQAYYDSTTNLTWLANANMNDRMTWSQAMTWAAGLDINGVTGWTLPTTMQPDSSCSLQGSGDSFGYNCTASQMGHLFYDVLGGTAGSPLSNTSPFTDIQSNYYWSATEWSSDADYAWYFLFGDGSQGAFQKYASVYAWAVHAGDVGSVPEPGAMSLMLMGLALVGFAARRRLALR